MTFTIDATYQQGVLKPNGPVALPEGAHVRLSVTIQDEDFDPLEKVIGIGDGPAAGDASDQHDVYIGAKPQP